MRTSIRVSLIAAGVLLAAISTGQVRAQERPHWNVEFIPNEVSSVSVAINNVGWMTWSSNQGHIRVALPPQWAYQNKIHIYASANPRGKNASIKVYWDDTLRQVMDFDNDEDHDVDRP
jgi:hypothetical protein